MKRRVTMYIILLGFFITTSAVAAPAGRKGASDKGLEHASSRSIFNRMGDWFQSLGNADAGEKGNKTAADKPFSAAEKGRSPLEDPPIGRELEGGNNG